MTNRSRILTRLPVAGLLFVLAAPAFPVFSGRTRDIFGEVVIEKN